MVKLEEELAAVRVLLTRADTVIDVILLMGYIFFISSLFSNIYFIKQETAIIF